MSAVLRAVYSCVCCPCVTVGCASPYDEAVQEANELYEATSTATANALKDNRTAALAAGATAVAVAAVAAPVAVMVAGGLFAAGAVATGNVDRVMQFLNVNPRNIPVEKPVENVKDDYDWRDDHNDDLPDLPPPPPPSPRPPTPKPPTPNAIFAYPVRSDSLEDVPPQAGSLDNGEDDEGEFDDDEFPATLASLGDIVGDDANPEEQKRLLKMLKHVKDGWARPRDLWGPYKRVKNVAGVEDMPEDSPQLFHCTSPLDVHQGGLGDCWLVSAMAALAEYPFLVRRLFRQQRLSRSGRYDVRLYDAGERKWIVITVDDSLPFEKRRGYYGNIMMASPTSDGEVWPCLLEKACAKMVGSYGNLDGGFAGVALEMLTGKPTFTFDLSEDGGMHKCRRLYCQPADESTPLVIATVPVRRQDSKENPLEYYACADPIAKKHGVAVEQTDEELWSNLLAWDNDGCIIVCSSRKDDQGVISGHAYSILRVEEVDEEVDVETGEVLKLVRIRNPHGCNEYEGRFSDNDEAWAAYPRAAEICGMCDADQHNTEDGAFWMSYAAFLNLFQMVSVNLQTCKDTKGRVQKRFDKRGRTPDDVDVLSLEMEDHRWEESS
ncbi:calpain catalytic domain-containing protein [Pseudoscourfieldia marina]